MSKTIYDHPSDPGRGDKVRFAVTDDRPDVPAKSPRRGGSRPGAGRPKLSPAEKRAMREVYMAPDVWEAVEAQARKFDITVSVAVEQLVQASLERATGRKPTDP